MKSSTTQSITVVVCDDDCATRLMVRETLKSCADIVLVGEAKNGREGIEQAELHRPNVVIMGLEMPELNGVDATAAIVKHSPGTRVILFSANPSQEAIDSAFAAGAAGYLPKKQGDQLALAIRRVAEGSFFLGV